MPVALTRFRQSVRWFSSVFNPLQNSTIGRQCDCSFNFNLSVYIPRCLDASRPHNLFLTLDYFYWCVLLIFMCVVYFSCQCVVWFQVGSEQLMQCREAVGEFLGHTPSLGYVARDRLSSSSAPRSKKRKVAHSSMEDDDVYESIRHLYSDEKSSSCGNCASTTLKASCSLEMHQDTEENTTGLVNSSLLVNWVRAMSTFWQPGEVVYPTRP